MASTIEVYAIISQRFRYFPNTGIMSDYYEELDENLVPCDFAHNQYTIGVDPADKGKSYNT